MMAPLVTIKHMLNIENATIAAGAVRGVELAQAVAQTAVTNVGDVVEGSLIKAVYIEIWVKSNAAAGTDAKFQFALEKTMSNSSSITFVQMNNLMTYPNKKNVLHVSQGVIGDLSTQSIPLVRQWFSIPKGKQRFGLDDKLVITISATSAIIQTCGLSIFKEWK